MASEVEKNLNPRLTQSQSSYLQSAARQPVDWYPWGEEAFQKAQSEDKPILLDIGAVWCHGCHVMDRESYENPEIASLINENFVPIKVDRDERPDVDQHYQSIVSAISGEGGWPLTAFLTPQCEVFYGGTYFPPEELEGRHGMKTLLLSIARLYRENKENVFKDAEKISKIMDRANKDNIKSAELSSVIVDRIIQNMIQEYDPEYGGFGISPKFPLEGAVELALEKNFQTGDQKYLTMVNKTLIGMIQGGIHDQLGGGFHRYSVDRDWKIPHFEIMLYVNAGVLNNLAKAYLVTGNDIYKNAAFEVIRYVEENFVRPEGGFYGSQDADVSLEDDGGYFTWSSQEVDKVLDPLTSEVLKRYYDIKENGEIETKNILFIAQTPENIAASLKLPLQGVEALIQKGKESLRSERHKRKKPFVDQNIYVNWNALMASAYFEAYKAFGLEEMKSFALKTLDFLMANAYSKDHGMYHVYFEEKPRVSDMFDDQVQMARACLDAFEVTGDLKYKKFAVELMELVLKKFWDAKSGGFFDVISSSTDIDFLKSKNFLDGSAPSSNAIGSIVLDHLYYLTGREQYKNYAQKTLEAFAETAQRYGAYAASYARALEFHLDAPIKVVIVGKKEDPQFRFLLWTAHHSYRPGKLVLPLDISEIDDSELSNDLRMILKSLKKTEIPVVFVCGDKSCASPTSEVKKLKELIRSWNIKR